MSTISCVHISSVHMFTNTNFFIQLPKARATKYFNIIHVLTTKHTTSQKLTTLQQKITQTKQLKKNIQPYFIANPRAKSTHMNNIIPNTTMAITRLLSFFINSSFFLNSPQIIFFCLSGTSGSNHLKKLHFLLTKYFPQP